MVARTCKYENTSSTATCSIFINRMNPSFERCLIKRVQILFTLYSLVPRARTPIMFVYVAFNLRHEQLRLDHKRQWVGFAWRAVRHSGLQKPLGTPHAAPQPTTFDKPQHLYLQLVNSHTYIQMRRCQLPAEVLAFLYFDSIIIRLPSRVGCTLSRFANLQHRTTYVYTSISIPCTILFIRFNQSAVHNSRRHCQLLIYCFLIYMSTHYETL